MQEVRNTVLEFEKKYPGASHKLVNGYTWPQDQRTADHVLPLSDKQFARKRQALAEYSRWDPKRGRYALGYHSVGTLMIDPAAADPHEYIDLPRSAGHA